MPRITLEKLDRGVKGTDKTIKKMHRLVALGKLDPTIQKIATWIRLQVPEDYRGATKETADAVFQWLKRHQVFQRDPFQIEKIEHPIEAMRPVIEARRAGAYKGRGLVIGDCDTLSAVFLDSLLGVLGFQYAFETIKVDKDRPDEFSHVYSAVRLDGEWYPLDPSTPGVGPGWRPPVEPGLLRRWPEKPIEDAMGIGHYGNGMGADPKQRLGRDDWPDVPLNSQWVEHSEYGYGIPKSIGNPKSTPQIPVTTGGKWDPLIAYQPAESRQDMERPLSDYTKRLYPEHLTPAGRQSARAYSRPYYVRKKPGYVHIGGGYPPGSHWGFNRVQKLYSPPKRYIHATRPKYPVERDVDVVTQQPIPFRRGKIRKTNVESPLVFMRPELPAASMGDYEMKNTVNPYLTQQAVEEVERQPVGMMGMGEEDWLAKFGGTSTAQATEAAKALATKDPAVAEATTSVWGTISKTITDILPTAVETGAGVVAARTQAHYAEKVAKATAAVTGVKYSPKTIAATAPVGLRPPTPFYTQPWFLISAAVVAAGIGYMAFAGKKGGARPAYRRRRRSTSRPRARYRRRNPSMTYRRRAA